VRAVDGAGDVQVDVSAVSAGERVLGQAKAVLRRR
jgi:hypothetical protein